MLSFECDYNAGAHERIIKRLAETNMEKLPGYGVDKYSESAKEKIKDLCKCPDADIYFLVGGTQANETVIASVLGNYEGVLAADTGHVSVHEAGAIEYTGHKVLTIPGHDGKIDAGELKQYIVDYYDDANHEHMVCPGMVYISHPTEYGTLYTEKELQDITAVCGEYDLPLFLDGARLGYGLMSRHTDVTLPMISRYCDMFYIGGTKVGALMGEAVVFTKKNTPKHFGSIVKQHGALLAKGRLTGIQFDELFTDDLYFKISKNAIDMAELIKNALREKGYVFYLDSPTNQQFVIVSNDKMHELEKEVSFGFWEKYDDDHTVIRFATSWATTKEDVDKLIDIL